MKWVEMCSRYVLTPCLIIVLTVQDLKYKKVNRTILYLAMLFLLPAGTDAGGKAGATAEIWMHVGGLVFGVFLLGICVLSQEALGIGDGLWILAFCVGFGLEAGLLLCLISFAGAAVCSAVLLFLKKIGKKGRLPFMPFLGAGYVMILLLQAGR